MSLDEFCDFVIWLIILAGMALGLMVLAVVLVLGTTGRLILAGIRALGRPCQ